MGRTITLQDICNAVALERREHLYTRIATITPHRAERYLQVLAQRTRYCTLLIEDLYVPHNVSAVLRTCDGLGIQDVHIFEDTHQSSIVHSIEKGASQWLTRYHYSSAATSLPVVAQQLKDKGYRIVAASPHGNSGHSGHSYSPDTLDIQAPFAISVGSELTGLSPQMLTVADMVLSVPLYGFVESYNVSVAAAIILYTLIQRLKNSSLKWQLSLGEQFEILNQWVR